MGSRHCGRALSALRDVLRAVGRGLRDLAAIDDLRLFVSTTPDRLHAKAVNEVRFQG